MYTKKHDSKLSLILLLVVTILNNKVSATSSPIKTVVVLVMENRSFDHMLGWMKKLNPEINGVNGSESNPVSVSDPNSKIIYFGSGSHYVDPDPGHSFQAIREQVFGSNETLMDPPPMNGFVQQAYSIDSSGNMSSSVMNGFEPDKVPVYKSLVSEFAVFDRWFASVPTSTQPNRMFVHSGTSGGATSNNPVLLALGYPQRTIFDNLDKDNISFGIYYQNIPAVLVYRSLRKLKYIPKFHSYKDSFKDHAKQGKLPSYTVIEQRFADSKDEPATDDHPSHDVFQGQKFIKEVYETLRASPQWNETLLMITYDEHGGFFDHVPTPVRNVPSPDGIIGQEPFRFEFNRLGIRVPTIAVSPWIEKGTVIHGPNGSPFASSEYEHSSIPATVKKLFNLSSPFLTKRDEWAGTFEHILQTRKEPRTDCPETLPEPVRIRMTEANENAPLSEFQKELVQLAAVLKGDHLLTSFPHDITKEMTVIEAKTYMEDAVQRFLEAGRAALAMGANKEEFVHMKPSLTERNH